MVDDYLDSFQALVSDASYMDLQTLVMKFRQGLQANIQSQTATMPYRRPVNINFEEWYCMAQKID